MRGCGRVVGLCACEPYSEPSEPVIFMGGGKWTFIDYDLVIISSITPVSIIKNAEIRNSLLDINASYQELFSVRNHMYDDYILYLYNPVVGRRLPNVFSQGAFLVTCFWRASHHKD